MKQNIHYKMDIVIKDNCYRGTRILLGNEKRKLINRMVDILVDNGFQEISIPIIQNQEIFEGKVGEENNNMMYNFTDRGDRNLCLAPEYTAIVQKLAQERFKYEKDLKLFYVQECFRGESPQKGRYRQFTQFGVEIINPKEYTMEWLKLLAERFMRLQTDDFETATNVKRGLDYYKDGVGIEIRNKNGLQLLGGGEYDEGIGFAIGIDRLILC